MKVLYFCIVNYLYMLLIISQMSKLFKIHITTLYNHHYGQPSKFRLAFANFRVEIERELLKKKLIRKENSLSFDYIIFKSSYINIILDRKRIFYSIEDDRPLQQKSKYSNNNLAYSIEKFIYYIKFLYVFRACQYNDSKPQVRRVIYSRSKLDVLFPSRETILGATIKKSFLMIEKDFLIKSTSSVYLLLFKLKKGSFFSNRVQIHFEIGRVFEEMRLYNIFSKEEEKIQENIWKLENYYQYICNNKNENDNLHLGLISNNSESILVKYINQINEKSKEKQNKYIKPIQLPISDKNSLISIFIRDYKYPTSINSKYINMNKVFYGLKKDSKVIINEVSVFISFEMLIMSCIIKINQQNSTKLYSINSIKEQIKNILSQTLKLILSDETEIIKNYINNRRQLRVIFWRFVLIKLGLKEKEIISESILSYMDNLIFITQDVNEFIEVLFKLDEYLKLK